MGPNERTMLRAAADASQMARDLAGFAIVRTQSNLVRGTRRRTGLAARWAVGIRGLPRIVQEKRPSRPVYPLIGEAETDSLVRSQYRIGDQIYFMSEAEYIQYLDRPSVVARFRVSRPPASFIADALDQTATEVRQWQWRK